QDADIAGCQNVVSGKQTVTIYKPINELAQKAAEIACSLAQGKSVEEASGTKDVIDNGYGEIPVLWMQPVAVTKRNMDEVIIKSGFHTKDKSTANRMILFLFFWTSFCLLTRFPGFRANRAPLLRNGCAALPIGGRLFL
ncbi:MAG: hypothetical protein II957_07605, partial [Treponema sp.]|nr:hypothetical protein [Treponema sp.]